MVRLACMCCGVRSPPGYLATVTISMCARCPLGTRLGTSLWDSGTSERILLDPVFAAVRLCVYMWVIIVGLFVCVGHHHHGFLFVRVIVCTRSCEALFLCGSLCALAPVRLRVCVCHHHQGFVFMWNIISLYINEQSGTSCLTIAMNYIIVSGPVVSLNISTPQEGEHF